jgi:serine/threonine protein kinase
MVWIAPEMVDGKEYGFSHDVWSYGIVLYELLHGGIPFIGAHEILNLQQPVCHIRLLLKL